MIYSTSEIRRQDRLLPESKALEILSGGEYGILSMCCDDSAAYGVPVNYAWDGRESIYIHCASSGKKLLCIDKNSSVSFCVVGRTKVIPARFATEYESIILQCRASVSLPADERMRALMLLVEKYSPGAGEKGVKYAEKYFHETEIIRLDVDKWSGKSCSAS
ncbi:MAG: pyridoxamine 5'-phosphate oxidase family protein [Bacteroidales bacterium]|nr:pyridoxamine 5'-phosphate oxidase family protein [Bacteroidales bacterium]